ncbi:hypothetical protein [Silvanigrella aquatica]|uniref:Uncharacterized protein n=1 Tax=Silvanigrella aquatica TaxID=1915309 RepID=A0A1L4CXZ0_9BACT|nr:hypothetical protein [Silvanigrella aquatica]APJ02809.1 hypothetical protein AXG55_02255 [Silvanigrella aquatica]
MPIFQDLKQFVRSENAHTRYAAIEKLAKNFQSWQSNLLIWQIMALIPTNEEKSKLVQSIKLTENPSSAWSIVSYFLLKETDDNVISSCIATISHSKRTVFSKKISALFEKKSISHKILYSLYNYIEETGDEFQAKYLINTFHNDLPEFLLAKGFNAFLKLGLINASAKNIAFQIIEKQYSFDLEKPSLISAIFYLGFSCDKEEYKKFIQLKNNIKNPEILRLLELIMSRISELEKHNFNYKAAETFIESSLNEDNPSFLGYGAIPQSQLEIAIHNLVKNCPSKNKIELTASILKLKNKKCIDILANNKAIGIPEIELNGNRNLAKIWIKNIPYFDNTFKKSIQNPNYYKIWHCDSNDLMALFLDHTILFEPSKNSWQKLFEINFDHQILFSQIIALGNIPENTLEPKIIIQYENLILENLKNCIQTLKKEGYSNKEEFVEKVYAATIGYPVSANFMGELYKEMPFSGTSWAFTAIALSAPRLDIHTISLAIQSELETIRQTLIKGNMEKEEYILEVTSRFQSILVGADRFKIPIMQPTLSTLKDISLLIQNILDKTSQSDDDIENESSDWSGNVVADRPVLRWGAILQVCLNTHLNLEEKDYYEKFIREGLRVAPHVEKRWIVRALVKLDTDDSIKAILYQALQHIDTDFVEHTIIELLRSKHPRAQQALIRSISKNNISNALKIKIINEISLENPEEILQELKTLQLMRHSEEVDLALQEAIHKISASIKTPEKNDKDSESKISSLDIDFIIKSFIPYSDFLSIDSKSALRTAEMILIQSKEWGNEAVDLSPIVNMHCKAVELTMRDTFEAQTDAIIRQGDLSKKLDILGYGKSLVEKMTMFEEYIANLPIIRTIPYFSKFKLRKMLRAICLYRPGKRFTLDGPKAFALLLLITARSECQFHLNKILPIHFNNDFELFDFIKLVHSLQDSRNRAVHEGLTWEARDEIETMRMQAYKIISTCLTIGRSLESQVSKKGDSPMESL